MVETSTGPVEVADLFFEDGTATRGVPFACFCFLEEAVGLAAVEPEEVS